MASTRDEVGKQIRLYVSKWKDPRGIRRTGFEAEALENDQLLAGSWSQRTLRIYTPESGFRGSLIDGDEWLVEVVGCRYSLSSPTTKDGRVKVRCVVRPIERVVSTWVSFNSNNEVEVWERCGLSEGIRKTFPYSTRQALFRASASGNRLIKAIYRYAEHEGVKYEDWVVVNLVSDVQFIAEAVGRLGKSFDAQKHREYVMALPELPDELRRRYSYWY